MANEEKRWKIFVQIPDKDIEGVRAQYGDGQNIKSQYAYTSPDKPTVDQIRNTKGLEWTRDYPIQVIQSMETKEEEDRRKAHEARIAAFNSAMDTFTLGGSALARRALVGAMDSAGTDVPFTEAMGQARADELEMENEHSTASAAGTFAGLGLSLAAKNPFGVAGAISKASKLPFLARVALRGAAPGVAYKTADVLSEGRLPTVDEELGAGAGSLAADLVLRGAGKAVSKVPGVNKIGPGIARLVNKEARPVAQRQVEGFRVASESTGLPRDLLSSTVLSSQPPVAPSGSSAPLYASMGRTTDNLLGTVKGSNSKAAASLARRVKKDLSDNDRALSAAIKKYQGGSRVGVGSPDNIDYRQRLLNDKYAGFIESMNTYDGKPLMLRVTKTSTPEGATRAEADLLNELSRMQASNEMGLGLSFDAEAGTATPAALMTAAANITKNNSVYTSARAKAAQDVVSDIIGRNSRFFGKGVNKRFVQDYFDDHRTLFREANAFAEGQRAVSSGRADLGSFLNETPREIGNIEKLRGPSAAAKAQKGIVNARKAGIMSEYLKNLGVATPEGSVPLPVYPKSNAVQELLKSSPEGSELLRRLFLKDSLGRSLSILTNPAVTQPTGAKGLLSRLVRAIVGKTGTYASQQLGLAGLEASYRTMGKADASKLASLLRMNSSKLKSLLGQKTVSEVLQPLVSRASGAAGKEAPSISDIEKALRKASGMRVNVRFEGDKEE